VSTAQELIFSRAAWESVGGFPEFPLAWASDDAFIATLGSRKSLRVIPGARIRFRLSGQNISSDNSSAVAIKKLQAGREFVEWAASFLKTNPPTDGHFTNRELSALLEDWFDLQLTHRQRLIGFKSSLEFDELAASSWQRPRGYGFLKAMKVNFILVRRRIYRSAFGGRLPGLWDKAARNKRAGPLQSAAKATDIRLPPDD
jgi:hypothetical protein